MKIILQIETQSVVEFLRVLKYNVVVGNTCHILVIEQVLSRLASTVKDALFFQSQYFFLTIEFPFNEFYSSQSSFNSQLFHQ